MRRNAALLPWSRRMGNPAWCTAAMQMGYAARSVKPRLDSRSAAVGTRIVHGFDVTIRIAHQRAGMAEILVIGAEHLDFVTDGAQARDDFGIEAILDLQGTARRGPGPAKKKARRVDRLGEAFAEEIAGEHLRLELRLCVAALCAVTHQASIDERSKRRSKSANGPP